MKFFWNKTKGLNADVERHRAKEQELEAKIAELEGLEDPMSIAALRTYRRFLYQLQVSKATIQSTTGKK
jgi:hypothetical protein